MITWPEKAQTVWHELSGMGTVAHWQAAEFKFESIKPLPGIWQSPDSPLKATPWPEINQRFCQWLQNQWTTSWGSAKAQLWQVRLASASIGHFCFCCCWQQPALFRKKCCSSSLDFLYPLSSRAKKYQIFVNLGLGSDSNFFLHAKLNNFEFPLISQHPADQSCYRLMT